MITKARVWVIGFVLVLSISLGAPPADTGDFDGDGRLSIADLMHLKQGLPPAPGSMDAFDAHPCAGADRDWDSGTVRGIVYLESLRRSVPVPLPNWLGVWSEAEFRRQPPLPEDARVTLILEGSTVEGSSTDMAVVRLRLVTSEPIRAYSILLEADGNVLRVPIFYDPNDPFQYPYREDHWYRVEGDNITSNMTGDVNTIVHPAGYLVTGGKLVLSNFEGTTFHDALGPGEVVVECRLRLPRGTRAGRYAMRLLPGSEVYLDDGTLLGPSLGGPADLLVESDVDVGWDEGLPPLRFAPDGRKVLGSVEFRVADAAGNPAGEGKPIAAAFPGDPLSVRVQMRTSVPLNSVSVQLHWPSGALRCEGEPMDLWANPEGGLYSSIRKGPSSDCQGGVIGLDGRAEIDFSMAAGRMGRFPTVLFKDRALEYFKPLGEWVDLFQLNLAVSSDAAGGTEIPLVLLDESPFWNSGQSHFIGFSPYSALYPCDQSSDSADNRPANWTYDVSYTGASVKVLGDQEPAPGGADAGIRFALGSASGRPGDTVEIPILASAEEPLGILRLVLQGDPGSVAFESLDLEVFSRLRSEYVRRELSPGQTLLFHECDDLNLPPEERKCEVGIPGFSLWRPTEDGSFFLDLIGIEDYPGTEPREIGRLRVRILPEATAPEVVLRGASVTWRPGTFDVLAESGGFLQPEMEIFSPVREIQPAVIHITGLGFLRGDANADGAVDLSDAVATLMHLFGGGAEPACLDAADADDSGIAEITDPIFLLGTLFLGQREIPPPHPLCGMDDTRDDLGCAMSCGGP